ncbi:MAG: BamA/TamA family outer membrane protein, partial [Fulvivirga sp.]|nr:BamA/TamA family outer membrane protein [Fulvivirga sp.]
HIKARRDQLKAYAMEYYTFLAKEVDVVGSDKHEHFQVDRLPSGDVHVVVRKMKKDGDKKQVIFDRLFIYGETKEIRLYGLGGEDEFEIEGESGKSIKVRVIGGPGEDELDDDSKVSGLGKKTVFYDTKNGNVLKLNNESKNKLSDDPEVNNYDRKAFQYNVLTPLITGNFNPDDGLFVGGGFQLITYGFRKDPFKWKHRFLGSYAINTASYNFSYEGILTDFIKNWNLEIMTRLRVPDYTNNFFGIGNESEFNQNIDETLPLDNAIDFYRLRFEEVMANIGISRWLGAYGQVGISVNYFNWELQQFDDRPTRVQQFLQDQNLNFNDQTFNYLGGGLSLIVDTRKSKQLPEYGILWENKLETLYGIDTQTEDYHSFNTSLSLYHSFRIPTRLTFAVRTGYGVNFGDYPFFRAQMLGGREEIRGYRRTRFYGDERFYNNFEVRLKLIRFQTYLFPASLGILAFHDVGRVWVDGEDSEKWHRGVGGGLWFTPFNRAALSAEVGHSEEETLFYVRLGFLF